MVLVTSRGECIQSVKMFSEQVLHCTDGITIMFYISFLCWSIRPPLFTPTISDRYGGASRHNKPCTYIGWVGGSCTTTLYMLLMFWNCVGRGVVSTCHPTADPAFGAGSVAMCDQYQVSNWTLLTTRRVEVCGVWTKLGVQLPGSPWDRSWHPWFNKWSGLPRWDTREQRGISSGK